MCYARATIIWIKQNVTVRSTNSQKHAWSANTQMFFFSSYLFSADTFLGDFFLSLGSERSCSNPLLSKSWRMAMLASCSANLKVSLMLRKTENRCSLMRVLTLITSGSKRVALFSSWVISAQRTTSLTVNSKKIERSVHSGKTRQTHCSPQDVVKEIPCSQK